ncbi:MAG: sulfhydrogenase subunit delta [gamma proteobacterium symbiont of Bathyaustriella thionipta]|nr:sulfhydrogenase subunit delta [gamma proteobacterium symbiont of Bathyaustriella thionipta]
MSRLSLAVHKFSSCDGCQLALLNAGKDFLELTRLMEIRHFAEAGILDNNAEVDIAIVEGSISTEADLPRIQAIRKHSKWLLTVGACATSGGLQALRNMHDSGQWMIDIYATPGSIDSLETATPISAHVPVDFEIWGCPITTEALLEALKSLMAGVSPIEHSDKLCIECKRRQQVCVMVTGARPCMGAVTRSGCGAICPRVGRACYGCYGPAENPNTASLANRFKGFGLMDDEITRRFWFINSAADGFRQEGETWDKK